MLNEKSQENFKITNELAPQDDIIILNRHVSSNKALKYI